MESRRLVEEFMTDLKKVPVKKTRKFFVVAMMGLQGTGKSTLAKKISDALSIPIASNDQVRGFLMLKGLKGDAVEEVMEEIIAERRKYYFEQKVSFIMDADTWPHWRRIGNQCAEYGAEMLLVKAEASEEVILARLKARRKDVSEYNAGVEDYEKRKKRWEDSEPPPNIFFIFDTEKDISEQFSEFLSKMKQEGFM